MAHSLRQVLCFQVGRNCHHSSFDSDLWRSRQFDQPGFARDFKSTRTLFTGTRPACFVVVRIRSELPIGIWRVGIAVRLRDDSSRNRTV